MRRDTRRFGPVRSNPRCSFFHFPINFFIRSITSAGCASTSLASVSISSPLTGSSSYLRFFVSAKNSGSAIVLVNASRRILTRSGGVPVLAAMGRPRAPLPRNHSGQAPVCLGRFVPLHELVDRGCFGQSRIPFARRLDNVTNEAGFAPRMKWLAGKKGLDGKCPAMDGPPGQA
jgi:hypothetical protein